MAVAQSTYLATAPVGLEGAPANMTNYDVDTLNVETAAGIAFGKVVGQGTADKGGVLGGALALFRGISVRDPANVNTASADKYPQYAEMGVANEGDWFVKPSVAVSPTDPVHYDVTTGIFQISGGEGPIVGARWMTSADADAIAVLRLSGHVPVP